MLRLRHLCEAAVFWCLLRLSGLLPSGWLRALGVLGGELGYWLDGRHRRIGRENLEQALGDERSPAERRRILRACWRHFGRITVESLAFHQVGPGNVDVAARYEGLEHIRSAYARGKGVLLFSAHFGNWELIALLQGYLGMRLALVTRRLDNPYLERMLAGARTASGNRVVHKQNAVREMLAALKEGLGVAIVIDQDARDGGVFVPFFGQLASTTPTLALLALRTGAAVIPTFSVPQPDGSYRIVYEPELTPVVTGDRDRDIVELTARSTAVIERWVRQYPELWLWMHRRWKSRPAEADSSSGRGAA